jgi:hypothetical protein
MGYVFIDVQIKPSFIGERLFRLKGKDTVPDPALNDHQ